MFGLEPWPGSHAFIQVCVQCVYCVCVQCLTVCVQYCWVTCSTLWPPPQKKEEEAFPVVLVQCPSQRSINTPNSAMCSQVQKFAHLQVQTMRKSKYTVGQLVCQVSQMILHHDRTKRISLCMSYFMAPVSHPQWVGLLLNHWFNFLQSGLSKTFPLA